jgi:hypothetical protein
MLPHKQTSGGAMSQNRNLKNREWSEKIEQWKLSGKKARTWCRENQVIYTTFMGWCKRLEINKSAQTTRKSSLKAQFIELKDQPKVHPEISLEYNGVIIHLKGEFDSSLMKKCLAVLRGIPC